MRHWTEQELLERVYGVRDADSHLSACGACRARLAAYEAQRTATAETRVPAAVLDRQRRAVYARAGENQRTPWRVAMATAAMSALAAGLLLTTPVPVPVEQRASAKRPVSDAELIADVYSAIEAAEPRAALPIRELFEEAQ